MFDIIWFTIENKDTALKLVKRLSPNEIDKRILGAMQGLRVWVSGVKTKIAGEEFNGIAVCRNFLGSTSLCLEDARFVNNFIDVVKIGDGIFGGNIRDSYFQTTEYKDKANEHGKSEEIRISSFKVLVPYYKYQSIAGRYGSLIGTVLGFPFSALSIIIRIASLLPYYIIHWYNEANKPVYPVLDPIQRAFYDYGALKIDKGNRKTF